MKNEKVPIAPIQRPPFPYFVSATMKRRAEAPAATLLGTKKRRHDGSSDEESPLLSNTHGTEQTSTHTFSTRKTHDSSVEVCLLHVKPNLKSSQLWRAIYLSQAVRP